MAPQQTLSNVSVKKKFNAMQINIYNIYIEHSTGTWGLKKKKSLKFFQKKMEYTYRTLPSLLILLVQKLYVMT